MQQTTGPLTAFRVEAYKTLHICYCQMQFLKISEDVQARDVLLSFNLLPRQGSCQRGSRDPEALLSMNLRKKGDRERK